MKISATLLLTVSLARGALAIVGNGDLVKLLRFSEGRYELSVGGTPLIVRDGGPRDTPGLFPLYLLHNVLTSRVAAALAGAENGKAIWEKTKDLPVEGWDSNGGALRAAYLRSARLSVSSLARFERIDRKTQKALQEQIDTMEKTVPTYGQLSKLAASLELKDRFLGDPKTDEDPFASFTIEKGAFLPSYADDMKTRHPLIEKLRNALEHYRPVLETNISPLLSRTNNRVVIGKWNPDVASAEDSFEVPGLFAPTATPGGEPQAHGSVSAPAERPVLSTPPAHGG